MTNIDDDETEQIEVDGTHIEAPPSKKRPTTTQTSNSGTPPQKKTFFFEKFNFNDLHKTIKMQNTVE